MTLEIIPAIDLKDNKCVQLVGGVFGSERIIIDDVLRVIKDFEEKGTKRLHIIDLNSAKNEGDNYELIKKMINYSKSDLEIGGGVRTIEKAEELIKLGSKYIIVGTKAIKDLNFLDELSEKIGSDKIIVALDYKNKKILINGWDESLETSPLEFGKKIQEKCGQILFTCVDKEGLMKGPDIEYLRELRKELSIPIIASGGISSINDLKELNKIGVDGAVIGMALYEGLIDLEEAIESLKK